MDESMLINGVLRSVLGGRSRRSTRALDFLTGTGQSGSFWANPNVLLTAAGLAWGVFETIQQQQGGSTPGQAPGASTSVGAALPPLPAAAHAGEPISDEAMRIVRLAISAANADGTISAEERRAIAEQAKSANVDRIIEPELARPRPLAEIVAGVSDDGQRAALYTLAFGILRADEQPSGAERIYLAKLAHLLGLDPARVQQLEQNAGQRIDAAAVSGQ
jgi:uncharacterized membrane protein YebE (DUF533 family)